MHSAPTRNLTMAPHRAVIAADTVSYTGATMAAVLGGLVSMFLPIHALAAFWLVVFQLGDIIIGAHVAKKRGRYTRDREERGIRDKLLVDAQLIVAIGVDMVAVQAGAWNQAILTGGALLWLLWLEGKSILRHIRAGAGKDSVWGGFDQVDGRLEQLGKLPPAPPAAAAPQPEQDR